MVAPRVRILIALLAAMVVLVGAGVAYASNSSSETTIGDEDDADDTFQGSISAPGQNESSVQKLANIDKAAAEQAALKAVSGTVHEAELETSDNGYVVYDIEVAGEDGNSHEVKVDAGNGEILHQDLEDETDEVDEPGEVDEADEDDAGEREDSD